MTLLEAETAYAIALSCLEGEDDGPASDEDLALLREAAEAGYAPAQYAYGNAMDYIKGELPAALPWFLAAARQGHADAHYRLRNLYAHREDVRTQLGELMTAEELERLQLRKANFIVWFFGREEGYNSHFGQLCAMLVGLAITCPLAWYNLMDFAAGWEGTRPWSALWMGMLIRQAGVWFGLCFLVAFAVDWLKPGEAGHHPLVVGTACLLLLHIAFSCLGFGLYELSLDSRWYGYRWVPGAAAALAGSVMLLLFLLQCVQWLAGRSNADPA